MDRLFEYRITLQHDNGTVVRGITASSIAFAIQRALNIEGAPESAISKIEIKQT